MVTETRDGVIVHRCPLCKALWFDATELNHHLATLPRRSPHPAWEQQIPIRGMSALSCPRCHLVEMDSVGWSGLILNECPNCHGFLVDLGELAQIDTVDTIARQPPFEQTLLSIGNEAGWFLLGGPEFFKLIARVLRAIDPL